MYAKRIHKIFARLNPSPVEYACLLALMLDQCKWNISQSINRNVKILIINSIYFVSV